MNVLSNKKTWLTATVLILLAALSRRLPHPPNFTPLTAMGLLGMAYLRPRWVALVIPFAALWLSSLLLDNLLYAQYYDHFMWFSNPGVYLSFLLVMGLAWLAFRRPSSLEGSAKSVLSRLGLTAVGASLLFWLASNFFVWLSSGMYPKTVAGLGACYTAALPFLRNGLAGDVFFTTVLFGAFYLLNRTSFSPASQGEKS